LRAGSLIHVPSNSACAGAAYLLDRYRSATGNLAVLLQLAACDLVMNELSGSGTFQEKSGLG
jgi:hypothetical protein